MRNNLILFSWGILAATIVLWGLIAGFVFLIDQDTLARASATRDAETTQETEQTALRLKTLSSATVSQRNQLTALFQIDPSSVAGIVATAGKNIDLPIEVSDATQEPLADNASSGVSAFSFVATAHGSFSKILQAAKLLENLPVPSSVKEVTISRAPITTSGTGGDSDQWQLNMQLQVLTTSPISS